MVLASRCSYRSADRDVDRPYRSCYSDLNLTANSPGYCLNKVHTSYRYSLSMNLNLMFEIGCDALN